jgi:hypothetical protein
VGSSVTQTAFAFFGTSVSDVNISSENITSCEYMAAGINNNSYLDVSIPFKNNGVYTKTYNAFNGYGPLKILERVRDTSQSNSALIMIKPNMNYFIAYNIPTSFTNTYYIDGTRPINTNYIINNVGSDIYIPGTIGSCRVVIKGESYVRNSQVNIGYIGDYDIVTSSPFRGYNFVTSVTFDDHVSKGGGVYGGVEFDANSAAGIFRECTNLKTIKYFDKCSTVTSSRNIFNACTNLVNQPALPNSLTYMRDTFYNCTNLSGGVSFIEGVQDLQGAYQRTNISSIGNIPNSVTMLRTTFFGCGNLTSVNFIGTGVNNMEMTFSGCDKLTGNIKIMSTEVTNMLNCKYYN